MSGWKVWPIGVGVSVHPQSLRVTPRSGQQRATNTSVTVGKGLRSQESWQSPSGTLAITCVPPALHQEPAECHLPAGPAMTPVQVLMPCRQRPPLHTQDLKPMRRAK